VAARRPRRLVLGVLSIAITVSGIVAALAAHDDIADGSNSVRADRLNQALLAITITLIVLAAVNAVFVTWATALDNKRPSALARALGATPQQLSAGLSAAQVLPALAGALLGIPGGVELMQPFFEAAEGIRTLDLLHGKRNAGSRASAESPGKERFPSYRRSAILSSFSREIAGVSGLKPDSGPRRLARRLPSSTVGSHPAPRSPLAVGATVPLLTLLHTCSSPPLRIGSRRTPAPRPFRQ
jgi:hypothetical protein